MRMRIVRIIEHVGPAVWILHTLEKSAVGAGTLVPHSGQIGTTITGPSNGTIKELSMTVEELPE